MSWVLTLRALQDKIKSRDMDTVIVADTDMQGRLYGKRLSAGTALSPFPWFLDGAGIIPWIRATASPDGEAAAYTEDAVVHFWQGQTHRGEVLKKWPARWFAFAKELEITKTCRGHHGNCITGTWQSRYTNPETG